MGPDKVKGEEHESGTHWFHGGVLDRVELRGAFWHELPGVQDAIDAATKAAGFIPSSGIAVLGAGDLVIYQ